MKQIPLVFCCFLLGLFILAEAHSTDPRPGWVDDQGLGYPEITYLTRLGFGDDRRSAERSAFAALARVFRPEIHSVGESSESFREMEGSRQKIKTARKVEARQGATIWRPLAWEQVEIAEYWFDSLAKIHYVLAVLNRDKAKVVFRRKLLDLELEAKTWSERARVVERPLLVAKALHKALNASRQADEYQGKLRVLAPNDASPLEESVMSADLQNQLNHLLGTHFQVEIALEGRHAAEVERTILESLNQIGLTSGSKASLSVAGAVRFEKTGPKSPVWHFVRWSTRITLTEKESGQVFGSIRSTGREGKLSPEEAEQKSLEALQFEVNKTIRKRIFQYIFGE